MTKTSFLSACLLAAATLSFTGCSNRDKEYKTVTFGSFAFIGATTVSEFGEPRTYGATIGFKY